MEIYATFRLAPLPRMPRPSLVSTWGWARSVKPGVGFPPPSLVLPVCLGPRPPGAGRVKAPPGLRVRRSLREKRRGIHPQRRGPPAAVPPLQHHLGAMLGSFVPPFPVFPITQGGFNVGLLPTLVTANQQENQAFTGSGIVSPVSRPVSFELKWLPCQRLAFRAITPSARLQSAPAQQR